VDGVASPYTGLWLIAIGWGGGGDQPGECRLVLW
jgi:hypothetical protein